MRRRVALLLACAALGAMAPPIAAQAFLDQGVFVISRNGTEIGREEFAIRATPGRQGQAGVLAVATVRYRDRERRMALELTMAHAPVSYQVDVTAAGRLVERLSGQFGGGRCAVRIVTPAGEVAREFPIPPGAVVLEDDAFEQFYFLPRATNGTPRRVMVLEPRETGVTAGEVRSLGPDTVVVADRAVPAERYGLTLEHGDAREFWVSATGDLLKVSIPSRSLSATRLLLPRR